MYEPFPGNYVWNLSVNICIGMGGAMGEMDVANEKVRAIAGGGEAKGTEAFFGAWGTLADRLAMLGDEAIADGHAMSACEKYARATAYYITAERMQSRDYQPRQDMYRTMLATMDKAVAAGLPAVSVIIDPAHQSRVQATTLATSVSTSSDTRRSASTMACGTRTGSRCRPGSEPVLVNAAA